MAYVPSSGSVAAWLQSDNASVITVLQNSSIIGINAGSVISISQGSVITVSQGSVATVIIGGSIAASFTPPANQSVSGTVNTLPLGTIVTSLVSTIPSSVIVGASIFGQLPAGTAPLGSVATLQGTNPWVVAGSVTAVLAGNSSVITVGQGSIATVIIGGSVATATTNSSVMLLNSANVIGSVIAYQGVIPWTISSVYGNISGSVAATVTNTVTVVSSIAGGLFPISGSVAATIVGTPNVNTAGSVVTFQGTSPWVVNFQNSSIIGINAGSVVTIIPGSVITIQQASSIVGTYAEDAGSASADKGIFVLGVRNDTLASVTSADADYGAHTLDAIGRIITKPFAGENATIISYTGSIVSGSVQLIQASVIGSRSYITDFWLSNTGATTTLVTLQGGDTSIVGQFIAPTGGGMSSPGLAIPLRTTLSQDLAFKVSPSTSVLYLALKGYQAP